MKFTFLFLLLTIIRLFSVSNESNFLLIRNQLNINLLIFIVLCVTQYHTKNEKTKTIKRDGKKKKENFIFGSSIFISRAIKFVDGHSVFRITSAFTTFPFCTNSWTRFHSHSPKNFISERETIKKMLNKYTI